MYHFSIPMALMDFIPVVFFGITAIILMQDLYNKMNKGAYALLAAGSVNVFLAGFCKALWKLLYAANICDFVALEAMFMPVNSLGLAFVGASLVWMVCWQKRGRTFSAAPVVFTSSMPFIILMTLGLGGLCAGLSVVSIRMKKGKLTLLFVLSFLLAMGMGALSGYDMTLAWVNWAEQIINSLSQGSLMAGVLLLHKAGLKTQ